MTRSRRVRLVVAAALALLVALPTLRAGRLEVVQPALAATPWGPADRTFHVTLTPPELYTGLGIGVMVPAGTWSVDAAPARTSPLSNRDAKGRVAEVVSWDPVLRRLGLQLNVSNVGHRDIPSPVLVVDFVSPVFDAYYAQGGGEVQDGHGARFGEAIPLSTTVLRPGRQAKAVVPLLIGVPGAPLPDRFDVYYHVRSATGQRFGLPEQPPLPKSGGKVLRPPAGSYYLGMTTVDTLEPVDKYLDRFGAKYGWHPAVYERNDKGALPSTTPASYVAQIRAAARRGVVVGLALGLAPLNNDDTQLTEGWNYQAVVDGKFDAKIFEVARAVRDTGYPVIGYVGIEFNTMLVANSCGPDGTSACSTNSEPQPADYSYSGDPEQPDGPLRFRLFARHVEDIFNEVGATNVTWALYPNNKHDTVAYTHPQDGRDAQPWWDAAKYYDPGSDYIDQVGFQDFPNFPNVAGQPYQTPPLAEQWDWHKSGYSDWLAATPGKLIANMEELPSFGTAPGRNTEDRSEIVREVFDTMTQFPLLQQLAFIENESEEGRNVPPDYCGSVAGYCDEDISAYRTLGAADLGFYHPEEIHAVRVALRSHRGMLDRVLLGRDEAAPRRVVDLRARASARPGAVELVWSAPYDAVGVDHYTVRCRAGSALSAGTWSRFDNVTGTAPRPGQPGSRQVATVRLPRTGSYACAVNATDAAPHTSPLSNVVRVRVG